MENVLFIQLTRLGDCLQTTPLLASWRRRFPENHICVLVRPEYTAVFERNPDIDETIIFNLPIPVFADEKIDPFRNSGELREWLSGMQSRNFRSVINLTHDAFSCWITVALAKEEIRGLYFNPSGRRFIRDPWGLYTFSLLKFRRMNLFNIVDTYAHLSGGASTVNAPVFPLDAEGVQFADGSLSGCEPGDCVVGFQPGASMAERRWPVDHFIRIGQSLSSQGIRVAVFGSKSEEFLGREIAEKIPGAINVAGKTTISQLAALLARCMALVTNDTGTMHLAAAVRTRVLALFESSAYFRETGPYGIGHWIIQSPRLLEYGQKTAEDLAGIRRIPPEEVLWALGELLGEVREGKPKLLCEAPEEFRALHFRSFWESGHLDFYPVRPTPLDLETVCACLQRPVWLATLDGCDLPLEDCAAGAKEFLNRYYIAAETAELNRILAGAKSDVNGCMVELKRMKRTIQTLLKQLSRNPNHLVSQQQLAELTRMENRILEKQLQVSIHAFLGYFEIGLAMIGGETTREYIEQYLRAITLLEKQLILFGRMIAAMS